MITVVACVEINNSFLVKKSFAMLVNLLSFPYRWNASSRIER